MKIKTKLLTIFSVALFGNLATLYAQGDLPLPPTDVYKHYERTASVQDIAAAQTKLLQAPAWQQFKQSSGATWVAEFDNLSQMPTRMYGNGAAVVGFDGTNHQAVSRDFLTRHLSGFVPNSQVFEFKNVAKGKKYDIVKFAQRFNDVEVLFSEFTLRIKPNGAVPAATLRYYPIENTFNTLPTLTETALQAIAKQGIRGTISNVEVVGLKILPVALADKYEPHLIQEIHVVGKNTDGLPFEYVNLIDAHDGKIWSRQNHVCTMHVPTAAPTAENGVGKAVALQNILDAPVQLAQPTEAPQGVLTVKGQITNNPLQPTVMQNLPFLGLAINNATTVFTDNNGNYNLSIAAPTTTTIKLAGKNAKVTKVTAAAFSQATGVVVNPTDTELNLTTRFTNTELAAYYHTTVMCEHFRAKTNGSTAVSTVPIVVTVDETVGTCNANFNGQLNFFAAGGGCPATALFDDVIYHEYGHYINSTFAGSPGAMQDGALNEGYADVWAMTKTDNPVLGAGFQTAANTFVRRYDQDPKVYPLDVVGEVHGDGEMIAGAWWDTRVNLNSLAAMTALFIETNAAYSEGTNLGDTFRGILLEALLADDTDANILNGTPNENAILTAFARHGITLITGSELFHEMPTSPPTAYTPFALDADFLIADNAFQPYFGGLRTNYHVNNGPWQNVLMADVSGGQGISFQTMVPGVPPGSIVSYYITATDRYGTQFTATPYEVNTANPLQSNLPNFLLCGYTLRKTEDFDTQRFTGNWTVNPYGTDNSTTGAWVLGAPVPSTSASSSSIYINPNIDHTAGATNTKCFTTANGVAGEGVGANDVDGGVTTLLSPIIDLSTYRNPVITYWRWFSNDRGGSANPGNDPLEVLVSGDGGGSWQHVEMTYKDDNQWRQMAFHVADYVSGTNYSQVRLRFMASDSLKIGQNLDGGSLVEMAVDDVQLWDQTVAVATETATKAETLHVFPNPASDFLLIGLGGHATEKTQFELYNTLGQQVARHAVEGVSEYRLDTRNLATGTYILRAVGRDWHTEQRVIIGN